MFNIELNMFNDFFDEIIKLDNFDKGYLIRDNDINPDCF